MDVFTLEPQRTSQKSFYGKALVVDDGTLALLKSYNTIVAAIGHDHKLHRLWGDWSATTSKHVNSFAVYYGLDPVNKATWDKMPVETESTLRREARMEADF